jgi:hypothetical protein
MRDNRTASFHYKSLNSVGISFLKADFLELKWRTAKLAGYVEKYWWKTGENFFNYVYRSHNKDMQSFIQYSIQIVIVRTKNYHRSQNAILLWDTSKLQLHEHSIKYISVEEHLW